MFISIEAKFIKIEVIVSISPFPVSWIPVVTFLFVCSVCSTVFDTSNNLLKLLTMVVPMLFANSVSNAVYISLKIFTKNIKKITNY